MPQDELIPANDFCVHHRIDLAFLQSLQEVGLLEMTTVQDGAYLHMEQVSTVEKFVHLHYDLAVNVEGLDVIHHMLQRMEVLQQEVLRLRNKLRFRGEEA